MRKIVVDFDGTLVRMPQTIRNALADNMDYIQDAEPNWSVVARLGINPAIVVTGRTDRREVEAFCGKYRIAVAAVYTTPRRIWNESDAIRKMQEHKARVINCIKPDEVYDDDAEVLKMAVCEKRFLVDHDGKVQPF